MTENTTPAPRVSAAGENELTDILIHLLKMSTLLSEPMKQGVCDPAGASTNEIKVIMALAGEGPLAGHDLAHINGSAPMNVSRAIAGCKARGWVEDHVDPDNRRRRPVRLTPAGEAAYRQLHPLLHNVADMLLGRLTQRQRREMMHITSLILTRIAEWEQTHPAHD
jgi:DNA-binding MarR family transcriptional regulator